MRIAVNAGQMRSGAGAANAGISRYVRKLVDTWIETDSENTFRVFVHAGVELPGGWSDRPGWSFVRRDLGSFSRRFYWDHVGFGAAARGFDVAFCPAHSIPVRAAAPRVVTIHDLTALRFPEFVERRHALRERLILPYAARHAEGIVTISEFTKADVARAFGVDPARIAVTGVGPSNDLPERGPEPDEAVLRRLGLEGVRFLFVLGTLEPRKNPFGMLEAFARVAKRPGLAGVHLVFGGGRGWKVAGLEERVARAGLGERIRFLGYLADADVAPLLRSCAAFVYPSLFEGFGSPVLEAMQAGAPVLASRVASIPEVGGDAILYFDPNDPDDMARVIGDFLVSPPDREAIAARQRVHAAQFTWPRAAELTMRALARAARG